MLTTNPTDCCTIKSYSRGWAVGTGLPAALEPGVYRVTGHSVVGDASFVHLKGGYHTPAPACEEYYIHESDAFRESMTPATEPQLEVMA